MGVHVGPGRLDLVDTSTDTVIITTYRNGGRMVVLVSSPNTFSYIEPSWELALHKIRESGREFSKIF